MPYEDWKNHKDYDELSCDLGGLFDARRLIPSEISGSFLTPPSLKSAPGKKRVPPGADA